MKAYQIILILITALIFNLGLTGCGQQSVRPVAINPKVDSCATCHMSVKDNQYATEIIEKNGKVLKFDDLGCLFAWTQKNGMEQVKQRFVRDYYTKQWIKIEDATFVHDPAIETPMAYNLVSFQNKQDAQTFIKRHPQGQLLTYSELSTYTWKPNMGMREQMKKQMKTNMNGTMNSSMNNSMNGNMTSPTVGG